MDPREKGHGWIGVDLDRTLAESDGKWRGPNYIGPPIDAMVERVKKWLEEGKDVRIFTARYPRGLPAIRRWCKKYLGRSLPITNVKDEKMIELWDDRAIQVKPNTGEKVGN